MIESVIAIVLIAILLPASIFLFKEIAQNQDINERRIQAAHLALEVVESSARLPFDQLIDVPSTDFASRCIANTQGCAPAALNPFFTPGNAFGNMRYAIQIECLFPPARNHPDFLLVDRWEVDRCDDPLRPPDYRRVTVTMSDDQMPNVEFQTVRTRQ